MKFHHSCDVLIHDTEPVISVTLIRFIFWSAHNQIGYSNNTSWYIIEPFSLSFVQLTSLLRWLINTDYLRQITLMTWSTYQMRATAKVGCSLFHRSRNNDWSLFKSLLLLWCSMILSITFVNRWVFPFVNNDSTYFFSPRSSISIGMFPIRWPTIATDIWTLRRKWSKLHVIYFSVLISNWAGIA